MLTVQPKISVNYQNGLKPAFKGRDDYADFEREKSDYESERDYYSSKVAEFDEALNDKYTPSPMKKVIKGFKVVSEALIEGMAVAWGAKKGSRVLKGAVVKPNAGTEAAAEILTPFGEKINKYGGAVVDKIKKAYAFIKESKPVKLLAEKFNSIIEKMNENKVGKYIVSAGKAIKKFFTFIADKIKSPFKDKTVGEIYDNGAKKVANILGVGAGAAGAYNAATGKDSEGHRIVPDETPDKDYFNDAETKFVNEYNKSYKYPVYSEEFNKRLEEEMKKLEEARLEDEELFAEED